MIEIVEFLLGDPSVFIFVGLDHEHVDVGLEIPLAYPFLVHLLEHLLGFISVQRPIFVLVVLLENVVQVFPHLVLRYVFLIVIGRVAERGVSSSNRAVSVVVVSTLFGTAAAHFGYQLFIDQ